MDIFEKASRIGLLFPSPLGDLDSSDLWNLPLTNGNTNLNDLAKAYNREVKEQDGEDYVDIKKNKNTLPQLRLDIVKRVIEYKLAQIERNEKRQKTQNRNNKIREILASKEDEELTKMDKEDLIKLLEEENN
jgi:chemotaxis signal transduction protein